MVANEGQFEGVLQRLLNRMDHIEFSLLRQSNQSMQAVEQSHDVLQEEVVSLRSTVEFMQKARLLEQEDNLIADTLARAPRPLPVAVSHRGPGAVPAPAPLPAPARPERPQTVQSQDAKATPSPESTRGKFTNLLVKSRPASVSIGATEEVDLEPSAPQLFNISSPPPTLRDHASPPPQPKPDGQVAPHEP